MHPLLLRRRQFGLYLFLWLLVGALLAALLVGQRGLSWVVAGAVALPLATAYSFVCLSAWYVARGMPLTGTGTLRILVTALAAAVLSSAIWLLIARAWFSVLSRRLSAPGGADAIHGLQPLLFGFGLLLYLLSLAVSYVLAAFEASQEAERRGLTVQVLAREAELRSLRAQIDPHFLFNSLHSISALTTADPAGARRMCLLLGDFLRETLALGGEAYIPLARELALIDRFLAIERVRFGDRLRTEISAGDAGSCRVPPLLLQPVVENAITHGLAHLIEGGLLRVWAERTDALLLIRAENPCDPDGPRGAGAGVGLANVRARLRAVHGQAASLTAEARGSTWRVEIVMPAIEAT